MSVKHYAPGIGEAVANRTISRLITVDGEERRETWPEVSDRVAQGSALLAPFSDMPFEYGKMYHHLSQASLLMSGRHLQHGDCTQPSKNIELFTNCSTGALSFLDFYLLLNGSGVGRCMDDEMMLVDWRFLPHIRCVIDHTHKDVLSGEIAGQLDLRSAKHLYGDGDVEIFTVPDSREGWAYALARVEALTNEKQDHKTLLIDFSNVRPRGAPIGGMQDRPASGPGPLMDAIDKMAHLRHTSMDPWKSTMYVDHYLAECVLVGGARRAARIATKTWRDKNVIEFCKIKRAIELENLHGVEITAYVKEHSPMSFLYSSNNSVAVDEEFWSYINHPDGSEMCLHANEVLDTIVECSYYDGTGEPGLINVDKLTTNMEGADYSDGRFAESKHFKLPEEIIPLAKKLAKVAYASKHPMIVNPCGEIVLYKLGGYCVEGSTRILTRNGYVKIRDVVGKKVEIYNGKAWAWVTPTQTGQDEKLVKVSFGDGSSLTCTPYHSFKIRKHRQSNSFHKVEAKDLQEGWCMPTFRVPEDISGHTETEAYTYGAFLGDGHREGRKDTNKHRYLITLYTGKHHLPVSGTRGSLHKNGGIRVTVSHLNLDKLDSLKEGEGGLPEWVFGLDFNSTLDFVLGWLDTDGCLHKQGGVKIDMAGYENARDLQLLLRRLGFSFVSIQQWAEEGEKTNLATRNFDMWRVYIPASEAGLLQGCRVSSDYPVDLERCVKQARILSVEPVKGLHDTFCFTEPERGMGVFGNVLTYQCVIADVVPFHAQDLDDAEDAFRTATRALMRTNTMAAVYGPEVKRTNRIGVGMTGFHEFAFKFFGYGWKDLVDEEKSIDLWRTISRFKRAVVEEAEVYAELLDVAVPHTNTTMKPAGTTSKLFGLCEGAHLPPMREYMRWVQFRSDDPLIEDYRKQGYPTKDLVIYSGTTIVGFPTIPTICTLGMGDKLVTASEATPIEQYKYLQLLEKYWITGIDAEGVPLSESGNQISYTLKYDPKVLGAREFEETLIEGQSSIRCCSVMPQTEDAAYEYLPEESVTKAEFEAISEAIIRGEIEEDIGLEHVDCGGGACPIDFK